MLTDVNPMKTPGRFFSGKHEIGSVCTAFVRLCMCKYTVNESALTLLSLGTGQEEQHANTSANYDVELLHHRDAHLEFFKNGGWGERQSLDRLFWRYDES